MSLVSHLFFSGKNFKKILLSSQYMHRKHLTKSLISTHDKNLKKIVIKTLFQSDKSNLCPSSCQHNIKREMKTSSKIKNRRRMPIITYLYAYYHAQPNTWNISQSNAERIEIKALHTGKNEVKIVFSDAVILNTKNPNTPPKISQN